MNVRVLAAGLAGLLLTPALFAQGPTPAPVRPVSAEQPMAPVFGPAPEGLMPGPDAPPGPGGPGGPGCANGVCGPAGKYWIDSEFLMWFIQGMNTPPLVTTSPPGTPQAAAGLLATPGTIPLIGQEPVDSQLRFGYRLRTGRWLDDEQRFGLEANFLIVSARGSTLGEGSGGTPILARPFANGNTNEPAVQLLAFPGVASGNFTLFTTSSTLLGAGVWLRENFWCSSDNCSTCGLCHRGCGNGGCGNGAPADRKCEFRFDSLLGYRFLRFSDQLATVARTTALVDGAAGPAGTSVTDVDEFDASNHFHGIDLGITGEIRHGKMYMELLGKVAVGYNAVSVNIKGQRATTAPGGGSTITPGGFLTQPSNIGDYTRWEPTAVPELGLRFGYQVRPNLRVYTGYTFLYWYHVVRAGDQIDGNISPAFLPGGAGPGAANPAVPAFNFQDVDIWTQGVSVGLEWRF